LEGFSYQREKVILNEEKINPKVGKRRLFLPSKRISLKSNFLSLRKRTSRSRHFLPKRKERCLKISSEENKQTNVPSTSKDQTFKSKPSLLTKRKHLKVLTEKNKHTNYALNLEDRTLKSKTKSFRSKINPMMDIISKDLVFVCL